MYDNDRKQFLRWLKLKTEKLLLGKLREIPGIREGIINIADYKHRRVNQYIYV